MGLSDSVAVFPSGSRSSAELSNRTRFCCLSRFGTHHYRLDLLLIGLVVAAVVFLAARRYLVPHHSSHRDVKIRKSQAKLHALIDLGQNLRPLLVLFTFNVRFSIGRALPDSARIGRKVECAKAVVEISIDLWTGQAAGK